MIDATKDYLEFLIHQTASDVVVDAGVRIYGTPQTSICPDTRGLNDFRAGVEAMEKALTVSQSLAINEANQVGLMQQLGRLIHAQNNRATSDPLFIVQQRKRIWGMDSEYSDDYEWVDEDDHEVVADAIIRAGLDAMENLGKEISGWVKIYYLDQWEFVTVCFTEKGCEDYIAANGHNLNEPRIYATSAYRNREMIALREMLKAAATTTKSADGC